MFPICNKMLRRRLDGTFLMNFYLFIGWLVCYMYIPLFFQSAHGSVHGSLSSHIILGGKPTTPHRSFIGTQKKVMSLLLKATHSVRNSGSSNSSEVIGKSLV